MEEAVFRFVQLSINDAIMESTVGSVLTSVSSLAAAIIGYPLAAASTHGLRPETWPPGVMAPNQWFHELAFGWGAQNLNLLLEMAMNSSGTFAGGGLAQLCAMCALPMASVLLAPTTKEIRRDPEAPFGDARWATRAERKTLRRGLEFGLDGDTGHPVRALIEGNVLSIAPPRAGKTTGLLIPNLAYIDSDSWDGPAAVVDPKGQVFKAVARRRAELGRAVRCLDPMNIAGGTDRWNPLIGLPSDDIAHLQRVARALLPPTVSDENAYFQNRAVDVIVAAFLGALATKEATPLLVSELLSSPAALQASILLIDNTVTKRVRELLEMDSKTRDPVLSTAQQTFQWCDDTRLQHLTGESTFSLADLCSGDCDVFLTLPTEHLETLSPLIRWFLADLFATIRRSYVPNRIIIYVDETRVLGPMKELITAVGELPGYNASLWTFWQARSQLSAVWGEADASTFLRSAEFITISDPAMIDVDELDNLSRALGDLTAIEVTQTKDKKAGQITGVSEASRAQRLVSAEELGRLPASDLILFANSSRYPKRPVRLRKIRHDDPRLSRLI